MLQSTSNTIQSRTTLGTAIGPSGPSRISGGPRISGTTLWGLGTTGSIRKASPVYSSTFEIESDLPIEISENIHGYSIDHINNIFSLHVYMNIENIASLLDLDPIDQSIVSIHDRTGNVIIKISLYEFSRIEGVDFAGNYSETDVMTVKLNYRFGSFKQEYVHDH